MFHFETNDFKIHIFFHFSSAAQCALYQQNRGMANLKAIAIRLKSVKNIQKITQSMKMVSAAKYARAERDLKAARPYGNGAQVRKIQEFQLQNGTS